MNVSKCKICGVDLPLVSHAGESPEVVAESGRACAACTEKLNASSRDGTDKTVIRPTIAPRKSDLESSIGAEAPIATTDATIETTDLNLSRNVTPEDVGHKPAQPSAPNIGKTFGKYEILEEISRGSFGVVYRARQHGLDRVVALKVLLAGPHASPEAIARFQREARAVARLKHPSIVPVYETGMEGGHHYFAMEFIEGYSLAELIAKKTLRIPDMLKMGEQLAEALFSAHAEGVIHRDIKPSNIIVDLKGNPHITDFGLAKQVDVDTQYTQTGTTLGTPAYMPPEQARGEVENIDARSDVYSLGAVLYEMFTRQAPYTGRTLLEVVIAVINEPVKPPRELNSRIHRDIQTIIMKCLEKDPATRYATAQDLCDDISHFRSGEAISARPISIFRKTARFLKRNFFLLSSTAIVLLTLGYLLGELGKGRDREDQFIIDRQKREKLAEAERQKERDATISQSSLIWEYNNNTTPNKNGAPDIERLRQTFGPISTKRFGFGLDLIAGRVNKFRNARFLISPIEQEFIGDLDATIKLQINEQGASKGFRIGFQSIAEGRPVVPYILSVKPGLLTLAGPRNLHSWIQGGQSLGATIKAEKVGPDLTAGTYTVRIKREGLLLQFEIELNGTFLSRLEIWDHELCHWIMKRVVLSLRNLPPGTKIISAKVYGKSLPQKIENIQQARKNYFRGNDKEAGRQFLDIVNEKGLIGDTRSTEELIKIAEAHYFLGLIQEGLQPYWDRPPADLKNPMASALSRYGLALEVLTEAELSGPVTDGGLLEGMIRMRLLKVHFARSDFAAMKIELDRIGQLQDDLASYPKKGSGLREPFGWQLIPLVKKLVPEQLPHPPEGNLEAKPALPLERALDIFKIMGVEPGWRSLKQPASRLAIFLASRERVDDLKILQRFYPHDGNQLAFVKLIHKDIEEKRLTRALSILMYFKKQFPSKKGGEYFQTAMTMFMEAGCRSGQFELALKSLEYQQATTAASILGKALKESAKKLASSPELLPELTPLIQAVYTKAMPKEIKPRERPLLELVSGCQSLATELILAGNALDLISLHKACNDLRLTSSFTKAVKSLALSDSTVAHKDALTLLTYCKTAFPSGDKGLTDAAYSLALELMKSEDGTNSRYFSLLKVQKAYPTSSLIRPALKALTNLNKSERFEAALDFYPACRQAFPNQGAQLQPLAIKALKGLSPDSQENALESLKTAMGTRLQEDPAYFYAWRLEFGDILSILGREDKAEQQYRTLQAEEIIEIDIRCQLALRLGVMRKYHSSQSPDTIWEEMAENTEYPKEIRVAGRFLSGQITATDAKIQISQIKSPLLFNQAQWSLIHALRLFDAKKTKSREFKTAIQHAKRKKGWAGSAADKLEKLWLTPTPAPEAKTQPDTSAPKRNSGQPVTPEKPKTVPVRE